MIQSRVVYEFGRFCLDPDERVLQRDGVMVALTPKATEILLTLVERRGHIVEKADLMRQVWPDTAVEESNLTQNIYTLRRALGDAPGKCPFIETVPKRGYRFIGPVREIGVGPADALPVGPTSTGGPAEDQDTATVHFPPIERREGRPAAHSRTPWVLTALAVLLIAFTAFFWSESTSPPAVLPAPELTSRVSRVTSVGSVVRAAISRNGRALAYAVSTGARESLWVKEFGSANAVQLIEPAVGTYRRGGGLSYGPDGWVYYAWFRPDLASVGIFRIHQQGGEPEPLDNVWDLPSFDPRGERFACITTTSSSIRDSRLLVYDAGGRSPRVVAMHAPPMTFLQMPPAWSPDGKQLAAWTMSAHTPGQRELVVVDVDERQERIVTSQRLHAIDGMVWTPDGASVIVAARERASAPLRLWQIPLAAPVMRPLTTDVSDYRLSGVIDGGRRIAAVRVDVARTLWVAPLDDLSHAKQIASDAGELSELESIAWTAGGRLLHTSTAAGNADIWVFDPVRGDRRQLTTAPHDDFNPASSPDGQTIVFASDRSGTAGLWTMSNAGESSVRQLTNGGDSRPTISIDGTVVFQRGLIQSSPVALWRTPLKGGDSVQLTHGTSIRPVVSPDGRLVAHYWLTPERWAIAVVPVEGGLPRQVLQMSSTHCGRTLRWSPDSRALAYIDCDGGTANIWLRRLDDSPARKLTDFSSGHIETFDWSRDGSQLAWITRNQVSDVVLIELTGQGQEVPGSGVPGFPVRFQGSAFGSGFPVLGSRRSLNRGTIGTVNRTWNP
jgi:DNA-binding winged helix-turn-helix (wHTH) protein/Tol biopolymer transport system component